MLSPSLRLLFALALCLALSAAEFARADPPGRVGRLALTEGVVMLHNAALQQWDEASINWPLTSGDTLHTGPDGRAEIRVGSSALRLDRDTEIRIQRLDDEQFHVWLEYGSVALRQRSRDPVDRVTIETHDGRALAGEPGRYRVDYAHATTTLTAEQGQLEFIADDRHLSVPEGQRVAIWFAGGTQYVWGDPVSDDFTEWVLARDQYDDALGAPRYVSPEMTGAEDLAAYGDWRDTSNYGPVWYPRQVSSGWAPYRHGRWAWVEPWGWTWVDTAPWGFAPFHYGRWVTIGGHWAWVPGSYVARPVYAPALVTWIGAPGWSVSFSFGHQPAVGWFPLGPRDVFVPRFRASPVYVRKVNITHVTNVSHITQVVRHPHRARFAHRHDHRAVTVVPVDTLARGRHVDRSALRDSQRWVRDAPIATALPRFERRSPDVQARDRSARFDQQRQRRFEHDRSRRAERLRTVETGAAPVRGQAAQTRPRTQERTRLDADPRSRQMQSDRQGQRGAQQLRQSEAARQSPSRGEGDRVRRTRESLEGRAAMRQPGAEHRQRFGEREQVRRQSDAAQRPEVIQRERSEARQRGQRPEVTPRGQRLEALQRGHRSSAGRSVVERPQWSGQRDAAQPRSRSEARTRSPQARQPTAGRGGDRGQGASAGAPGIPQGH